MPQPCYLKPNAILDVVPVFPPIHLRRAGAIVIGSFLVLGALYAFQKPFREYPGVEYERFPLPQGLSNQPASGPSPG